MGPASGWEKKCGISLDVEIEKKASWTRVTNVMKKLVAEQEAWDKSLRAMAAQKLTAQANEWLADNDQTDRDPEEDPITKDELPGASCSPSLQYLLVGVLPSGMRTTICSGAMWSLWMGH